MKKVIFSIVSLLFSAYGFCQERFLHLRAIDRIEFSSWETLYASCSNDTVIIRDTSGLIYHKFVLNPNREGEYGSDMVISENGRYHSCSSNSRPCKRGNIILDDAMKLYFDENSKIYNSSHRDHGSHYSHYSSR